MDNNDLKYTVVINVEEQYAIWPALSDVPKGWSQVGPNGTHEECEAYVEANWTDMTPKSQRA